MFKKVLMAVVVLIACAVSAKAETDIADIAISSASASVSVSSSSLAGDITTMDSTCVPGRKTIEIQNLHATANLFCGLTTVITSSSGRKIVAGGAWVLGIRCNDSNSGRIKIFCVNDTGSAATTAWVTQLGNK